jgi:GTP pyrophosphokinase
MSQVAGRLALHLHKDDVATGQTSAPATDTDVYDKTIRVLGTGDVLTQMARCCSPVPGDAIVGYVTRARGVTVHRTDCPNVVHSREKERFVDVEWGERGRMFPVAIKVEAWDRVGLIRDLSTVIAEERINIGNLGTDPHDDRTVTVSVTFETTGVEQLYRLFARIEGIQGVFGVARETDASVREIA